MGKKPLRATICFSSSMRVHAMSTNIQRQDGNENCNKTIGLISKTTTLLVHHAFIFAFLCHFCTTTTWRCLILRFMDNTNKQRRNLFFFSLLNLDRVPWNSTPFGFTYIWPSNWEDRNKKSKEILTIHSRLALKQMRESLNLLSNRIYMFEVNFIRP